MTGELLRNLQRCVRINRQSDARSTSKPTTSGQVELLRELEADLTREGAEDVVLTENGYLAATIGAVTEKSAVPMIAWVVHVDTSPDCAGEDVRMIVHENYDGKPIVLPDDPKQIIDPKDCPYLAQKVGETIITAGGTTLLGADDGAGIAVIVTAAHELLRNRSIRRGKIRLLFTSDEEIGRSIRELDLALLDGVAAAYNVDGGERGTIVTQMLMAENADVTIRCPSISPGFGRGKYVNPVHVAARLLVQLEALGIGPEHTSGMEPYVQALGVSGGTVQAVVSLSLRAFSNQGLVRMRKMVRGLCKQADAAETQATVYPPAFKPRLASMRKGLEKDRRVVDYACRAYRAAGMTPRKIAVRAYGDGAALTVKGIPTPYIFAGPQNQHSLHEWVSLDDMRFSVRALINLAQVWERQS